MVRMCNEINGTRFEITSSILLYSAYSISLLGKGDRAEQAAALVIDDLLNLLCSKARAELEAVEGLDSNCAGGGVGDQSHGDRSVDGAIEVVRIADTVGEVEGGLATEIAGVEDLNDVQLTAATLKRAGIVTLPAATRGVLTSSGNSSVEKPVSRHVHVPARLATSGHGKLGNENLGSTLESLCTIVSDISPTLGPLRILERTVGNRVGTVSTARIVAGNVREDGNLLVVLKQLVIQHGRGRGSLRAVPVNVRKARAPDTAVYHVSNRYFPYMFLTITHVSQVPEMAGSPTLAKKTSP